MISRKSFDELRLASGQLRRDNRVAISGQQLLRYLVEGVLDRGGSGGTRVNVQTTSKRSSGYVWGMTVPGAVGSDEAIAGML